MRVFGVIMAGGGGTRFWPMSRHTRPKQVLNLTGRDTMVGETITRVATVAAPDDIFIVTNKDQVSGILEATGGRIALDHILAEPAARNTAACIGYAAEVIRSRFGDGIMCVFPSDHYIRNTPAFTATLEAAVDIAERENCLVTLGIQPTFPCTGYGYIRMDRTDGKSSAVSGQDKGMTAYHVSEFREKPDLPTAEKYLASGEYAWNSGMFVWKASVILDHMRELLPEVSECMEKIGEVLGTAEEEAAVRTIYPGIPSVSIDYGIMERSDDVRCIAADMGWNDVGSWDGLDAIHEPDEDGNIFVGEHVAIDTTNSVTFSGKRLIATVGVDNLVVVETEDAILVCDKSRAQEVRRIVDQLKAEGKEKYL